MNQTTQTTQTQHTGPGNLRLRSFFNQLFYRQPSPWVALIFCWCGLALATAQPAGVKLVQPTPEQAAWQDLELGLFIHYDMPVFKPGWDHRQYEKRPEPSLFNPRKLNTDQWLEAARAMGAKYAVFVAKHGSGFMGWQSDLYPYGMKQSPFQNGQGDIVRDFVNSCRKYGIQPGIYAHMGCNGFLEVDNPGLVNRGRGGDLEKQARYARICEGMLTELWGNYGELSEIWFDGGVLDPAAGGPDMLPILRKFQPKAIVFQGPAASIRWIGNEDGVAPYPCWATVPGARDYNGPGHPDGPKWLPGECDVPIREGIWMWQPNTEGRLFTVAQLVDRYYRSVGHNCNLLLNANPDPDGLIPEPDMKRYREFGEEIRRRFSQSIAETAGQGGIVELALARPACINHVITMENILEGERVREYVIEGLVGGQWRELCRGASIGHKKIDQFPPVEVSKVRWRSLKSAAEPRIRKLALYSISEPGKTAQAVPKNQAAGWEAFSQRVETARDPLTDQERLALCNVTWNTPSTDSLGSMPLGNGDVGLNVWVEGNGDLLFYISKVDAFDAGHVLPKLGRLRLRLDPPLPLSGFQQTLALREGAVTISGGDVRLRVWVDAHHPVIRVEGSSSTPRQATLTLESLRSLTDVADAATAKLPASGTVGILLDDREDRLAWCFRNQSSVWTEQLRRQNSPGIATQAKDPLANRTAGCWLQADGFVRENGRRLALKSPANQIACTVHVFSEQTATLAEWFAHAAVPVKADWAAHQEWWHAFWARSYIMVGKCGEAPVRLDGYLFTQYKETMDAYCKGLVLNSQENAFNLTQRYALERFAQACASRGAVPPPYNGSIFTMDLPAGTHAFSPKGGRANAMNADQRDWGNLLIMWQNTRHPYWSMLARGDYDTMAPVFTLVRDSLAVCRDRCRKWFQHEGAFMTEAMLWGGVSYFDDMPGHLVYHYLSSIELPAMMCDYYEHTQDRKFLAEILLPCVDEFVKFYDLHYPKRDAQGKRVIEPAGVTETYQPVTNPVTEVSGLRYLLARLGGLGEDLAGPTRMAYWAKFLKELPAVPHRTIKGMDLLAPGQKYAGRLICETPELYAVYPFRQVWLGKADFLASGRQSFHVRQLSLDGTSDDQSWETGGWQSAPIWAAFLGLPREAARLVTINFDDRLPNFNFQNIAMEEPVPGHPRPRFPGFWETKMDYTPDNDHGSVSANALQSLLLQSDESKIYLLPAWPEDWDVAFKLHAPQNTTVEAVYRSGRIQSLKVTPLSRQADVIDMSSLENRVRTLAGVACADRNYLFEIPPMLDARVSPGDQDRLKTTGPWLAKYGESLVGTRAGPFPPAAWGGSVFKGNTVYLHILDATVKRVPLPGLPRQLLSVKCLTGGQASVWHGDGRMMVMLKPGDGPAEPDVIVQLDFDGAIAPLAMAAPYRGSLTTGAKAAASNSKPGCEPGKAIDENSGTAWEPAQPGRQWLEIDFGKPVTFDRIEIAINNPGHRRGQAHAFGIETREPNGSWKPCWQGHIFGNIYGRRVDPITAQTVRLNIDAAGVRQFDLFPPNP